MFIHVLCFQNLAAEKTYNNLDVSLREANEHRNEWFEGVQSCKLDETLFTIMERIVRAEVRKCFFFFFFFLTIIVLDLSMLKLLKD